MLWIRHNKHLAFYLIAITVILYALAARDGHNWKGDFSQYIIHAQNLIQGKPYTDMGVLSLDGVAHAGTPPGYPLTLAPILALFGINFVILKVQMAIVFGLGLLIYWLHIKDQMPRPWALGALAFLCFSPWVLKFSNNLLTDIPYLTASLFSIFLAHRFFEKPPTVKSALFLSLGLILACAFRSVGIVIIGTVLGYALLFRRKHFLYALGIFLVSYASVAIIYRSFEAGSSYATQFSLSPSIIATALWQNLIGLERTLTLILSLFPSRNEESVLYIAINKPILLAYLSLMGLGLLRSYKKRGLYIQDLYLPLSLFPLLIYPYPMRPRYLLPLLPFTHFYVIIGLRGLIAGIYQYLSLALLKPIIRYRFIIPSLVWMPLFCAYWGHYTLRPTTDEANVFQDADVKSLFQEIKKHSQEITHVLFWRPRILYLFTGVKTAGVYNINQHPWSQEEITAISDRGVSHIILDPHNPKLSEFVQQNPERFESVYQNQTFHVMRIKNITQ